MIRTILTVFVCSQILFGQSAAGRFVAYDTTPALQNYREPRQRLIVEIEDKDAGGGFRLIKVVYFVPTKGTRDSVEEIPKNSLNYQTLWRMYFSQPKSDEEKRLCAEMDNFSRDERGRVYIDKKREPVTVFYSTRFPAEIIFNSLPEMPCFTLKKFELTKSS